MTEFCRICLVVDLRLHNLYNSNLQQTWEKITNVTVDSDSLFKVCYICAAELKKCSEFMKRCVQSCSLIQEVLSSEKSTNELTDLLKQYESPQLLAITKIQHFDLIITENDNKNEPKEVQVKYEVLLEENKEVEVKNENEVGNINEFKSEIENCDEASSDHMLDIANNCSTDSEDEIPLMKMALKKTKSNIKKEVKVGKTQKYKKVKIKADVITLTHEEQLQEMTARSKSSNYLESPYKCNLCYKGFINPKAIQHHMQKHDEKQGPHECPLCHLRYSENKTVRAHSIDSHARIYRCKLCDNTTRTLDHAREHQNWHNGYMFSCQLCGMQYQKSSSYFTHLRKSHTMKHECKVCGDRFVSAHGLAIHDRRTHKYEREQEKEPNSKCDICGVEIKRKLFKAHMETHEIKKRVKCTECGNSFKNRTTLQMHCKNKHLGRIVTKNIVCETCGKVYSSKTALIHHQRTHNGEKPFSCTVCNKSFAMKWNLTIHYRMHSGDRPYQCEICNKKFAQKAPLTRHYRVHTGAKPYTCHLCTRSFSQSTSLKFHINTVHLNLPSGYKRKKSAPKPKTANTDNIEVEFKINDEK